MDRAIRISDQAVGMRCSVCLLGSWMNGTTFVIGTNTKKTDTIQNIVNVDSIIAI